MIYKINMQKSLHKLHIIDQHSKLELINKHIYTVVQTSYLHLFINKYYIMTKMMIYRRKAVAINSGRAIIMSTFTEI